MGVTSVRTWVCCWVWLGGGDCEPPPVVPPVVLLVVLPVPALWLPVSPLPMVQLGGGVGPLVCVEPAWLLPWEVPGAGRAAALG